MGFDSTRDQDTYSIYYDPQEHWLYVDWVGYISMRAILQGCEEVLYQMQRHRTPWILNDNSRLTGMWIGASQWGATSWFPQLCEAGLHSFAWVYSPELMARVCADFVIDQIEAEAVGVGLFQEIEPAKEWLRQRRDSCGVNSYGVTARG